MELKSIFQRPVDRHIEGVIKADDEAGLKGELEEYVLTDEVSKRLDIFLNAYNRYEGANGVWVSGSLVLVSPTYSKCWHSSWRTVR